MKDIKKSNIIFNKNGNGFLSTKMNLPLAWIKELGFNENNKQDIVEIYKNKIIIRKDMINMLLIKNENVKYDYERYDYELENGILLNFRDYNGEAYIRGFDKNKGEFNNNSFKPVFRFELDDIDISELEENSKEWDKACEIVGFKEI